MSQRFNLSDWTLHHRTLVGYFLFALALMGIFAFGRLSQAEDPPFTFKVMVIRSIWPGATARQVEQQLTDRIERKLQETPGIERVSSYSRPGEPTVLFVARDSTPPAQVPDIFYQVRKKVADIRHTLPAGVQGPFFNDEYGDVLGNVYALTADGFDSPQLKDIAERLSPGFLGKGDEVFACTSAGKEYAVENLPIPPAPQKRTNWGEFLGADTDYSFAEYLGIRKPEYEYRTGKKNFEFRMFRRRHDYSRDVEGEWAPTKKAAKAGYKAALQAFKGAKL